MKPQTKQRQQQTQQRALRCGTAAPAAAPAASAQTISSCWRLRLRACAGSSLCLHLVRLQRRLMLKAAALLPWR
jgi:hypothetical protein